MADQYLWLIPTRANIGSCSYKSFCCFYKLLKNNVNKKRKLNFYILKVQVDDDVDQMDIPRGCLSNVLKWKTCGSVDIMKCFQQIMSIYGKVLVYSIRNNIYIKTFIETNLK